MFDINDPLVNQMKPHESYVYSLGLDLVINNYAETTNNNSSVLKKTILDDFNIEYKKCKWCDFTTESEIVMDTHLLEPHLNISKYRLTCNYCLDYSTISKSEYINHLSKFHNRSYKFKSDELKEYSMCTICDFECKPSLKKRKAKEAILDHMKSKCPFRTSNLDKKLEINSKIQVDFQNILNNLQSPSQIDLLNHEFLFNTKPIDKFIQNYDLFTPSEEICSLKKSYLENIGAIKIMQILNQENTSEIDFNENVKSLNKENKLKMIENKIIDTNIKNESSSIILQNPDKELMFIITTIQDIRKIKNSKNLINSISQSNLIEARSFNDNCYICSNQTLSQFCYFRNLLNHLRNSHDIKVNNLISNDEITCLFCGIKFHFSSLKYLVIHQYSYHKAIFVHSLRQIFVDQVKKPVINQSESETQNAMLSQKILKMVNKKEQIQQKKITCSDCSLKFETNLDYEQHLFKNHMKNPIVKLKRL